MNKKSLLALAASTLMFAACGDDVTNIQQSGLAVLEKGEKLSKQACDTTNVGEMLFVTDSSEVFFCDGESWQTLKGADGKDGKDGEKGEKGDKGAKGDSGKDGDNGTNCTTKSVENGAGLKGVEVTCGEAVIDTIWNGEKGEPGDPGKPGEAGTSCSAKSVKNKAGLEGLEVTCGETVVDTIWNGEKGEPGDPGKPGEAGTSCTAKSVKNKAGLEGVEVTCGETVVDTIWNGEKGEPGDPGKPGDAGTSCSAKSVKNKAGLEGIEVTCGKTVIDTIWNGEKGDNGEAGKSAYEIAKENGFEGTEAEWLESMKGPFIQDKRDGKIYKTVKIGDQVWMAENLNYSVNPGKQSWCYNDSAEYCEKYGRLYTWAAAIDSVALANDKDNPQTCGYDIKCTLPTVVQGVCPEGWHLPDTTELRKLFDAVGGKDVAGKMLKSANGWNDYEGSSGNGSDAYGFSALLAVYRSLSGSFIKADSYTFWSASEYDGYNACRMTLFNNREDAVLGSGSKRYGFSVRCLQNN